MIVMMYYTFFNASATKCAFLRFPCRGARPHWTLFWKKGSIFLLRCCNQSIIMEYDWSSRIHLLWWEEPWIAITRSTRGLKRAGLGITVLKELRCKSNNPIVIPPCREESIRIPLSTDWLFVKGASQQNRNGIWWRGGMEEDILFIMK